MPISPNRKLTNAQIIELYTDKEMRVPEIAKLAGLKLTQTTRIISAEVPMHWRSRCKPSVQQKVIDLYRTGLKQTEVAGIVGICVASVHKCLKDNNEPMRKYTKRNESKPS